MEVQAITKNVRIAPRKAREVMRKISGLGVEEAQSLLAFIPRKAARLIAVGGRQRGGPGAQQQDSAQSGRTARSQRGSQSRDHGQTHQRARARIGERDSQADEPPQGRGE